MFQFSLSVKKCENIMNKGFTIMFKLHSITNSKSRFYILNVSDIKQHHNVVKCLRLITLFPNMSKNSSNKIVINFN